VVGLEKIHEIAERVAASSGLEVVEVDLRGGGKARMLRIYIDKPGGVTHDDCSNFSREVGTIFDVEDAVPGGSYTLEVSSPGLDRKLSKPGEFERFSGSLVKLMTRDPVNANRHFEEEQEARGTGSRQHGRTRVGQRRKGQSGSGVLVRRPGGNLAAVERTRWQVANGK